MEIAFNKWKCVKDSNASGGTYHSNSTLDATSSLTFGGKSIQWLTETGPDSGQAEVSIDGANQGTVDLYSPTAQSKVVQTFSGLNKVKLHTIEIRALHTKNASSTGFKVSI